MVINNYGVVDRFLGCLEAKGWLSAFTSLEPNISMAPIAEFYHFMDWPSLSWSMADHCEYLLLIFLNCWVSQMKEMSLIFRMWLRISCFGNTFLLPNWMEKCLNRDWDIKIKWMLRILFFFLLHNGRLWCPMCCHKKNISMMLVVSI